MDETVYSNPAYDKKLLKELAARSDRKGLAHLLPHLALLAGSSLLIWAARGSYWLLPAQVLQGFLLITLFAPLHECIHRTAFRSRRLNDAVAWFCGTLLMLPPNYFRAFHFAHHRFTQDPDRDPELAGAPLNSWGRYLFRISGIDYWRRQIEATLALAAGKSTAAFIPPPQRAAAIRESRLLWLLYALLAVLSVALGTWGLVVYWILPILLGQPFLRLYLLAEHTGCPLVPDMLENTRTTRSNALVRWLFWNMPYHVEHHAYPALPFHALPTAHNLIKEGIAVEASGYIAANREIARFLLRGDGKAGAVG